MKDVDVVDLFDEEINKREKKLNKRVERMRLKEEKQAIKEAKKLEKVEDQEFDKYLKKVKEEKLIEEPVKNEKLNNFKDDIIDINEVSKEIKKEENNSYDEFLNDLKDSKPIKPAIKNDVQNNEHINMSSVEKKLNDDGKDLNEIKIEKKHPFLNFILGVCSICLLVISVDYISYNAITNYKDLQTLINSILLVSMVILYLLSIVIKNNGIKKFFQILSMLAIIAFMGYHLFIV